MKTLCPGCKHYDLHHDPPDSLLSYPEPRFFVQTLPRGPNRPGPEKRVTFR